MDERLQKVINVTAEKFNLEHYFLKRYHIFREQSDMNETTYILNMEWFPNDTVETNEDYNPAGTASIDVDLQTNLVKRIIFVNEENKTEDVFPESSNTELAIEWIEEETGLEFGRQFKLNQEEERELFFQAAVDNIAVFPSGFIQMEFNNDGKLSLFSMDGSFPNEDQLNWEPFALTAKQIDPIAKSQIKLLEIPFGSEEKWKAIYGTTTAFVTNDGKRTISFEEVERPKSYIPKDVLLEWQEPIKDKFIKQDIDLSSEVTLEEAFNKGHTTDPENDFLTVNDQQHAEETSRNILRGEFPDDSGKWKLTGLWREKDYIFAEIKPVAADARVIDRKIKLIIDGKDYKPMNYVDNRAILDMFDDLENAEVPQLSKEEAFDKLYEHIEITPVYVFDKKQNHYILCGKIDCEYGVDAVTGEILLLDEL